MGQLDVCRLLAAAVVDRECRRHLVDGKLEKALVVARGSNLGSFRINLLPEERFLLTIGGTLPEITRRFIPSDVDVPVHR
ncbi:MAG: hypothetical protein UU09_C0041G0010 [Microgenomates group bacterium GW2011_GWA2_40_6]|nr:MAG: hypothetical protein UU09_C0041G0010 [Microgenomates group bacterium GW2011_GWA2_40_6]